MVGRPRIQHLVQYVAHRHGSIHDDTIHHRELPCNFRSFPPGCLRRPRPFHRRCHALSVSPALPEGPQARGDEKRKCLRLWPLCRDRKGWSLMAVLLPVNHGERKEKKKTKNKEQGRNPLAHDFLQLKMPHNPQRNTPPTYTPSKQHLHPDGTMETAVLQSGRGSLCHDPGRVWAVGCSVCEDAQLIVVHSAHVNVVKLLHPKPSSIRDCPGERWGVKVIFHSRGEQRIHKWVEGKGRGPTVCKEHEREGPVHKD